MKFKKIAVCSLMVAGIFGLSGCNKKVAELENGEDVVVSLEGTNVTADELYQKVKNSFALESLITLVDTHIFEAEFPDYIVSAKEYAESSIESLISNYGDEESLLEQIQYYTNYSTIEAYQEYIYLSYLQSHAAEEYAKSQITDKQIKKYYKTSSVGDIEINHILITSGDDEDAAKNTINEIIEKLKSAKENGENIEEKFSELAKEYSQDDSTKNSNGSLGRINKDTLSSSYDELVNIAYKLKDGEFSTEIITTELGYHVIYRVKSYEKDTLENLSDSIRQTLAEKLAEDDSTISVKALQYYRKKYGMQINDTELQKQYSNYIQNLLSSLTKDTEEE